jgi:hypothetical protein
MLKKYNGFLLEKFKMDFIPLLEGYVFSSTDFIFKLRELSKTDGVVGQIAKSVYELIVDEDYIEDDKIKQNYFDLTDKDDMVSFLQNSKIPDDYDEEDDASALYSVKGRGEIKVGRAIKYLCSLIDLKVVDKDIETFVNTFKSSKVDDTMEFKLVKGNEISKYYNEKKYFTKNGSLGNSCMADEKKSTFRIYSENETKVQLLVYVDSDDKIHGRALLWKLKKSPCDAKYFMDRVYTNRDSDEIRFKRFADEKGWLYKKKMSSSIDDNVKFVYKGQDVFGEVTVKLDGDFSNYPFVDTMCFLSKNKNTLSNLPDKEGYQLHSVYGDCNQCDDCDGNIILRSGWSGDKYLCNNCAQGHDTLKELGVETKWNKKISD